MRTLKSIVGVVLFLAGVYLLGRGLILELQNELGSGWWIMEGLVVLGIWRAGTDPAGEETAWRLRQILPDKLLRGKRKDKGNGPAPAPPDQTK